MGEENMTVEPNRDLMRAALNAPASLRSIGATLPEIEATIAAARSALAPLTAMPEDKRAEAMTAIEDVLRPLAAKVMPTASEEAGQAWLVAVAAALSDLPPRFVVNAGRSALHQLFKFPNEIEAAVRTIAEGLVENQHRAIRTLERMKAELERATAPKQQAIQHQPKPWTVERVRTTPRFLIDLGLAGGFIDPAIVAQAFPDGLPDDSAPPAGSARPAGSGGESVANGAG